MLRIAFAILLAAGLAACVSSDGANTPSVAPATVETVATSATGAAVAAPLTCTLPDPAKWAGQKLTSVDQLPAPYQSGDRALAARALAGDPQAQAWVVNCLGASL